MQSFRPIGAHFGPIFVLELTDKRMRDANWRFALCSAHIQQAAIPI